MTHSRITNKKKSASARWAYSGLAIKNTCWLVALFIALLAFALKIVVPALVSLAITKVPTEQQDPASPEQDDESSVKKKTETADISAPPHFFSLQLSSATPFAPFRLCIAINRHATVPTPPPWFKS